MTQYIRKVMRVGKRSLAIVLPPKLVEVLRIRERQRLSIHRRGDKLIVVDTKD